MTNPPDDPRLVEAATTPARQRDRAGRPLSHPAWADLSPEGRRRLYQAQLAWRALERIQGRDGLSGSAQEVLVRSARIEQE